MTAETPVQKDDPRMIAWTAYKATETFANTRRWALRNAHADDDLAGDIADGTLWAAFVAGFAAGQPKDPDHG